MDPLNPAAVGIPGRPAAFTLIELLMVICIFALVLVFVAPALNSIATGSNLSRAGQMVGDQINLARQEAVTRNQEVDVVFFYRTNGAAGGWSGLQLWRIEQGATNWTTNPISRLLKFPEGVVVSSNQALSPLLASAPMSGVVSVGGYGQLAYRGFRFRPNGTIDNSMNSASNYLTLQNLHDGGNPPANYYTLQVNALTGKVTVFRP